MTSGRSHIDGASLLSETNIDDNRTDGQKVRSVDDVPPAAPPTVGAGGGRVPDVAAPSTVTPHENGPRPSSSFRVDLETQKLRRCVTATALGVLLLGLLWSGLRYLFMIIGGCFFRFPPTDYDLWKRGGDICQENIWISVGMGVLGSVGFNAQLAIGCCAFLTKLTPWMCILAAASLNLLLQLASLSVMCGLEWYVAYYIAPAAAYLTLLCLQYTFCVYVFVKVWNSQRAPDVTSATSIPASNPS